MKALSFKISKLEEESIKIQEDKLQYFYDLLHFHPEYQITIILKGNGVFTIGENKIDFEEGDMFVIGSNIPHVFRSDRKFYESPKLISHSISTFFKEDSFGGSFFHLPETKHIGKMFPEFNRGIKISASLNYTKYYLNVVNSIGFNRLQNFLILLDKVCKCGELQFLSKETSFIKANEESDRRLNAVFNYVLKNYSKDISLKKISEIANLSEPAFCRYFKKRTRKTFFNF